MLHVFETHTQEREIELLRLGGCVVSSSCSHNTCMQSITNVMGAGEIYMFSYATRHRGEHRLPILLPSAFRRF